MYRFVSYQLLQRSRQTNSFRHYGKKIILSLTLALTLVFSGVFASKTFATEYQINPTQAQKGRIYVSGASPVSWAIYRNLPVTNLYAQPHWAFNWQSDGAREGYSAGICYDPDDFYTLDGDPQQSWLRLSGTSTHSAAYPNDIDRTVRVVRSLTNTITNATDYGLSNWGEDMGSFVVDDSVVVELFPLAGDMVGQFDEECFIFIMENLYTGTEPTSEGGQFTFTPTHFSLVVQTDPAPTPTPTPTPVPTPTPTATPSATPTPIATGSGLLQDEAGFQFLGQIISYSIGLISYFILASNLRKLA